MIQARFFALLLAAGALLSSGTGGAAAPGDRRTVAEVPPQVLEAERVGRADPDHPMERMLLLLPSKDLEGRDRFLAAQQTPGAPEFRRWLTPEQFHERFGADPSAVRAATSWLEEQGFSVEAGHPGRAALLFSGTAAQVEAAFATRIGLYSRYGRPTISNETPASLPAPLAGRVVGLVSLNGFVRRQPLSHRAEPAASPLYNSGANHLLAPADFWTIYNVDGLLLQGVDGTGRKIAVIGRTQVDMNDTRNFRSSMGLPANDPTVILNGPDPGILSEQGEVVEANLDLQWSGATAPGASILFVVSKSTQVADGVDLSIQHAVEKNLADAATVSFGACEREIGTVGMQFYDSIWAQAAAQGISAFIASGDSGAAGCESANAPQGQGLGMNGLSTSPWNTCVGGTQFLDTPASTYWSSTNDPTTKKSVLSYIPEAVWNESGAAGGASLWAGGGGPSITFARPAWQHGPGVPTDGKRSLPDISLAAARHTGYLVRFQGGFYGVSGTSASSPAMSGIAALVAQRVGGRIGNMNPTLYALGRAQYGGGGPQVFHDVTTGNNSVPSVTGFSAGPAYDMGTGLGSIDSTALANAWPAYAPPPNPDFLVGVTPGALVLAPGSSASLTVTLTTLSGFDATAQISVSGLPAGLSAAFTPAQYTGGPAGFASSAIPGTLTLTANGSAAPGTYPIVLTAVGGSVQRKLTIYVTVAASGSVPPASGVEKQVPVVLDVYGAAGSHYTSDLVAVNRGESDVTLQIRYVAAPGTSGSGGPVIARSLPAGRQLFVADVIAFLKANGYAIASDGSKIGTLFVTFAGASDASLVFAGSRTSTPNQNASVGGSFGTFSAAVTSGSASTGEAWVYGLKENASFRSNLAVVHAPGGGASLSGGSPITVEVQIFDGATGVASGAPVARTLQPGEFWQLNSVLGSLASGYARVRRTAGSDRFITYGVVNDGGATSGGGTSDGSLIVSGGSDGLVPIVLDLPGGTHYQTEVSLTNTATESRVVTLTYTPSSVFGGGGGGTRTFTMAAGQQIQQTNAISWLRSLGFTIPADGKQGGTLLVSGAVAMGRTYSPNPDAAVGGTYGVAYPALDSSRRARTGAWVYGLRQDAEVRSNLAIADARAGDAATREYTIDVFDSDSGSRTPVATLTRTLAGGDWTQIDGILSAAGISHGYARVRPASGSSDFVAYGVVNDGPSPGTRTSDGSYLPMAVEN